MRKFAIICMLCCSAVIWANQFTAGQWTLDVNVTTGETDIIYAGTTLVAKNRAHFRVGSQQYDQAQMTFRDVTEQDISDDFGTGKEVCVISEKDDIRAFEYYYIYSDKPYILTQLVLVSSSKISSNYLAPVYSTSEVKFLPAEENYNLFVPWDNDEWVSYNNYAFGGDLTSCEVTTLYNAPSGNALVVGSIEHTVWKTGVTASTKSSGEISSLKAFGGLSNNWTRDYDFPHGSVSGTKVSSPKIMVGYFSDWRDGMEQYADLNAIVAPRLPWEHGKPFIWNSWGVIQTALTYDDANQVSLWMAENLPEYKNDGTVYVCLDSYWDNLTTNRLKQFAKYCHDRGQKAGIYWTPFVDWSNTPDRQVEGTKYTYSDIWLRKNGQPIKRTSASACDPTHPGTRARIEKFMGNFRDWGYDFVKLDFMDHGALQADSYSDPSITTAMQAYASGMALIDSVAGDMYINLSIAPLFPTQFAHGRRIACDAYASIDNTKYTLNSTTFGWWLDRAYTYNDADNLVFQGQSENVNRIRTLSGVITGILSIGDDFSKDGDATAKERAIKLLNNKALMQCASQTKAFRPIDAPSGTGCASTYYTTVADTVYLATINWNTRNQQYTFDYGQLGLEPGTEYTATELWSGSTIALEDGLNVTVKKLNCLIFKIHPKCDTAIDDVMIEQQVSKRLVDGQVIIIRGNKQYTLLGQSL